MTPNAPRASETRATRPNPRKRRRGRKVGIWALLSLAVLGAFVFVVVSSLAGRPISAPEWVRSRIEARVDSEVPGLSIRFGDIVLVVDHGWRPRLHLQDVRFADASGKPILSVADMTASVAMQPLLKGQVQPRRISLNGVFAQLRRGKDGRMALSLGNNAEPMRQASNLGQLIEDLDEILTQPGLSALASFDIRGLNLRYEDERSSRAWTVDGGRLKLERNADDLRFSGDFAVLSGGADVATLEMNYDRTIGTAGADFGVNITDVDAGDIALQGPALAWLNVLRAPISGALRGRVLQDGSLGPLSATLQIGTGVVQPTDETQPIPFEAARSYFTYSPGTETIQFDELSVESKWVTGRAEGQATLVGVKEGRLEELVAQFALSELVANPAALYDEPVALDGANVDLRLRLDPFELTLGQVHISDRGQSLLMRGDLRADQKGWQLALDGEMDQIAPERLLELWPKTVGFKTRAWLEKNLLAGVLTNIDLALRAAPSSKPNVHLNFDFSESDIRFVKTMPPIRQASGHASLLRNRFALVADAGFVQARQGGRIDITGTSFIVPDVTVKQGAPAVVRMRASSTVTAALSMLDSEPIHAMSKAKLPVTVADGSAVLEGTIALPLRKGLKPNEVEFSATGTVSSVRSSSLIPGRVLASDALTVTASNSQVEIAGPGRIGAVGFDGRWSLPIGTGKRESSTFTGTVELSERAIDEFNIDLPPGSVSGAGLATVRIGMAPGQPATLDLRSTLQGIGLNLSAVNWSKPPGGSGAFQLSGTLGEQPDISRLVLDAPGLSVAGKISLLPTGGMDRAVFSRVVVGDWMDAPVVLSGRGPGAPPDVVLTGGEVDMRRATFGSGENPGTGALSIALDRLQITDSIALTDFRGDFRTAQGLDGRFTGNLNGGTEVTGQLVPQGGRTAMRISSDDAGGVFRSAGFMKQARDGDFSLTLVPVGDAGSFDGSLRITGTRIKDAPVMAELLNAMSVVGLLEQLGGQGIHFSEVDAKFRMTPSQIIVTSSSAVGTSMGLSMDGVYAVDSNTLDMRGVITPVYLLNGIGSVVTRKGEGVFGFNYSLTGNATSPTVLVNPLSALAPGMFRDLLRPPAPSVDDEGNVITAPPAPELVEDEDTSR